LKSDRGKTEMIICKRSVKPCFLCMIGFIPDVMKCKNRVKFDEEKKEEKQ
jgi:hypothetical protein